jgi:hypothetical protein
MLCGRTISTRFTGAVWAIHMSIPSYISAATRACSGAMKAINELVKGARSEKRRRTIFNAIKHSRHSARANALIANLAYGDEVSYSGVLYNIIFMVHIRKGMLMCLEKTLSNEHPTQEEIDGACRDIYSFARDLEMSIWGLHGLIAQLNEKSAIDIPISLGMLLAETEVHMKQLISDLRYNEATGHNETKLFSDPTKRHELEQLCSEMNRMIDTLCDTKLAPRKEGSTRQQKRSGPTSSARPKWRIHQVYAAFGNLAMPD